jgi:hypothetical protein
MIVMSARLTFSAMLRTYASSSVAPSTTFAGMTSRPAAWQDRQRRSPAISM